MALIERNARLRDRKRFVDFQTVKRLLINIFGLLKPSNHPHVRDLNSRLARDVGISETDLAKHRLRLPSQHDHHPRS